MPQLGTYTQRNYTDFDGTELVPLVDGGTMYKTTVAEVSKYIQQNYSSKPVSQGNITASPTSLSVTAGARNVFWCNTSGGSINVSSLSVSLGLLPGQTVIFRKTTADANHVLWTSTTGGSGQTKTLTLRLTEHYANEPKEIELVWDGAAYTPISTWHDPVYGLDITGATSSATAWGQMLTDYSGRTIQLPAGTIMLTPADANGWTIPANTRLIGHQDGTTINFKTPTASANQKWIQLSSGVRIEDITFTWDTTTKPTAGYSGTMFYAASANGDTPTSGAINGIKFKNVTVTGCGGAQDYVLSNHFCMQLLGVVRSEFDACTFKHSLGSSWGVEIVGGEEIVFRDCHFLENSSDGIKVHGLDTYSNGNTLYTRARNHKFFGCSFYRNGWQVLQGESVYTATYTTASAPGSVVNGGRYRLDFGSNGNFTLPNGTTNGDLILLHRKISSAGIPTITHSLDLADAGDNFYGGAMPSGDLPIKAYDASETRDLIRSGIRATWNSGTGKWVVGTGLNGEGFDGAGEGLVFEGCSAWGNQGAGFQIKSGTASSAVSSPAVSVRFTDCTSYDNWNGGFIVHNADGGYNVVTPPQTVTFTNCTAYGNMEAGYSLIGSLVHVGTAFTNCVARSNRGYGFSVQRQQRETLFLGCQARGNGKSAVFPTIWNVAVSQSKKVKIIGCVLSGVDPADQGLETDADIDNASNARCNGLYVLRESSSQEADAIEIHATTFHNHSGSVNISYAYQGSSSGTLNNWGESQLWYPQAPISGEAFLPAGSTIVYVPFTRPGYHAPIVGKATSGAASSITDTGAAFPTSPSLAGYVVRITGGIGAGQWRTITSNTATALTISTGSTDWTTTPDSTSTYEVVGLATALPYTPLARDIAITPTSPLQTAYQWQIRNISTTGFELASFNSSGSPTATGGGITGTATGTQTSTTLKDTSKSWTTNQYVGFTVRLTGTLTANGAGQYRTVLSNTSDTLTLLTTPAWSITPVDTTTTYVIGDFAFGWSVRRG